MNIGDISLIYHDIPTVRESCRMIFVLWFCHAGFGFVSERSQWCWQRNNPPATKGLEWVGCPPKAPRSEMVFDCIVDLWGLTIVDPPTWMHHIQPGIQDHYRSLWGCYHFRPWSYLSSYIFFNSGLLMHYAATMSLNSKWETLTKMTWLQMSFHWYQAWSDL